MGGGGGVHPVDEQVLPHALAPVPGHPARCDCRVQAGACQFLSQQNLRTHACREEQAQRAALQAVLRLGIPLARSLAAAC